MKYKTKINLKESTCYLSSYILIIDLFNHICKVIHVNVGILSLIQCAAKNVVDKEIPVT